MEVTGFEPVASHMRSERSTTELYIYIPPDTHARVDYWISYMFKDSLLIVHNIMAGATQTETSLLKQYVAGFFFVCFFRDHSTV